MVKKLVVIAPTYNEEENIKAFIEAVLLRQKDLSDFDLSILISDSHSTDKTPEIVGMIKSKNSRVHYLDVKKRGLGLGLWQGFLYARDKLKADVIATMEADLSCDPVKLKSFLAKLSRADLVVGSRYLSGGKVENWAWWRKILSQGANLTLRILTGLFSVHEFTNLYRVFNVNLIDKLEKTELSRETGWLFVPKFLLLSVREGAVVVESPFIYRDRFGGRSKMNTVSYTLKLLKYALKFRFQKSNRFFKFLGVGFFGLTIDIGVYFLLTSVFHLFPVWSSYISGELAITNNYIGNNLWTFKDRKITKFLDIIWKFLQFNATSLFGVLVIRGGFIALMLKWFGSSFEKVYFFAGTALIVIWNYGVYNKIIWRVKK